MTRIEDELGADARSRQEAGEAPFTIRIKWEHGQWWAYFRGWHKSYMCSQRLDWMCNAINTAWPKGTK